MIVTPCANILVVEWVPSKHQTRVRFSIGANVTQRIMIVIPCVSRTVVVCFPSKEVAGVRFPANAKKIFFWKDFPQKIFFMIFF